MYLGIGISEFAAVFLGISSNVCRNYCFTYIELFRYFYRNYSVINNGIFKTSIDSVITGESRCDLFGVVVRALNVEAKILGLNLAVHEEFICEEQCTVEYVIAVYYVFLIFFFSYHIKTRLILIPKYIANFRYS
jgi:hypothetical protein